MKENIIQSYSAELFQFLTGINTLILYSNKENLGKKTSKCIILGNIYIVFVVLSYYIYMVYNIYIHHTHTICLMGSFW